jgi:hypothetical protein
MSGRHRVRCRCPGDCYESIQWDLFLNMAVLKCFPICELEAFWTVFRSIIRVYNICSYEDVMIILLIRILLIFMGNYYTPAVKRASLKSCVLFLRYEKIVPYSVYSAHFPVCRYCSMYPYFRNIQDIFPVPLRSIIASSAFINWW